MELPEGMLARPKASATLVAWYRSPTREGERDGGCERATTGSLGGVTYQGGPAFVYGRLLRLEGLFSNDRKEVVRRAPAEPRRLRQSSRRRAIEESRRLTDHRFRSCGGNRHDQSTWFPEDKWSCGCRPVPTASSTPPA